MSKFSKLGIVLAFVLAVLSVTTSFMLAVKEIKYREIIKRSDTELKQNQTAKATVKQKLEKIEELNSENKQLAEKNLKTQEELKAVNSKLDELQKDLKLKSDQIQTLENEKKGYEEAKTTNAGGELVAQINEMKEKLGKTENEMKSQTLVKQDLQNKVDGLMKELAQKNQSIANAEKRETDLKDLALGLKNQLEQLREVSQNQQENSGKAQALVEVVNREMKFIVFGMGERDGLKVGDNLSVYRGEKYLGSVSVDEVFQNMASATISSDLLEYNITEGDVVKK